MLRSLIFYEMNMSNWTKFFGTVLACGIAPALQAAAAETPAAGGSALPAGAQVSRPFSCGKEVCDCRTPGSWCGQVDWSAELFRRAAPPSGNALVSPFSAAAVLSLAATGANGRTAEEMAKTLGFPDMVGLLQSWPGIFRALDATANEQVQLEITQSLWPQRQTADKLNPRFVSYAASAFQAGVTPIDMNEAGQREINAFVKKATHGRIPELFSAPPDPATQLLLINTVWLKAKWEHAFEKHQTQPLVFHAPEGDRTVPFLQKVEVFDLAATNGVTALRLPYAGGALEMLVVLPEEGKSLSDVERDLSIRWLRALDAALTPRPVQVQLPKFEFASSADLTQPLIAMGMGRAFSGEANFSGISREVPLMISQVFQQANITVDEEGTEAAAATAVMMMKAALAPRPEVTFRADRPFLFLIRAKDAGTILFLGRVASPTAPAT